MNATHLGLLTFIVSGIAATGAVVSGRISVPVYVAVVGFCWLLGKSITHWHNPGELKVSLWEDLGIVWKIRERAEFVAAKVEEVRQLDESIRAMLGKVVEATYLANCTDNIIPKPRLVSTRINDRLNEIARLAIPDASTREAWIQDMDAAIQQVQQNPRG